MYIVILYSENGKITCKKAGDSEFWFNWNRVFIALCKYTHLQLLNINLNVGADECLANPCGVGSTCEDGINSYTCVCRPGTSGQNCTDGKENDV